MNALANDFSLNGLLATAKLKTSEFVNGAVGSVRSTSSLSALFAGIYTFVAFVLILTPLVWGVSHLAQASVSWSAAVRGSLGLMWSALGGTIRLTSPSGEVPGSSEFVGSLILRPTLLSLVFLLVAAWVFRATMKRAADDESSLGWSGTAFGVGVALTGALGVFLGRGSIDWNGESVLRVLPPRIVDVLVVAVVVIVPTLWLASRKKVPVSDSESNGWLWSRVTLATFVKIYTVAVALAIFVYLLVEIIRPQFITSSETPQPLLDFSWNDVAAPIAAVVLFLPTIVIFVLSYLAGVSIGQSGIGSLSSEQASSVSDVVGLFPGSGFISLFGGSLPVVLLVIATLCSLGAGGWAAIRTSYVPTWLNDSRRILVSSLLAGFALLLFTESRIGWTNNGVPAIQATNGQVPLESGFIRLGLGGGAIALMCFVLMVLSLISSTRLIEFLLDGMPRLTRRMAGKVRSQEFRPKARFVWLGRLVVLAVTLAVVLPVSGAVFERAWAIFDGPGKVIKSGMVALETGNVKTIQDSFGFETDENKWLSEATMRRAMSDWAPGKDDNSLVTLSSKKSINNSHDRRWKLSELDAVGIPQWTLGDKTSRTELSLQGTVSDRYRWFRHADYAWTTSPLSVSLSAGQFYPQKAVQRVTVNGNPLKPGTFYGVPGFYQVSAPAYGVIAATNQTFYFDGTELTILVGSEGNVPKATEDQVKATLDRSQKACESVNAQLKSACVKNDSLLANKQYVSGTRDVPDYDSYKISNVDNNSLTCGADSSRVNSTVSVLYSRQCNQDVTFTITYVKNAITEPIYETRTSQVYVNDGYEEIDTCPYESYYCYEYVPTGYYETRSRQVVVGQRLIEPRKTFVTKYKSETDFAIRVQAVLQKNKSFKVTKLR